MRLKELLKLMMPDQKMAIYTELMGSEPEWIGEAWHVPWHYAEREIPPNSEIGYEEKFEAIGVDVRYSDEN